MGFCYIIVIVKFFTDKIKSFSWFVVMFLCMAIAKTLGKRAAHGDVFLIKVFMGMLAGCIAGGVVALFIYKSGKFLNPMSAVKKYVTFLAIVGIVGGLILAGPVALVCILYILFMKKSEQ